MFSHAHPLSFPCTPFFSPTSSPPLFTLQTFSALMEGSLLRKRKPRAYLVPSPTNKSVPSHPFKPTINKRSKKMAARLRPAELSPHDILHYNAEAVRARAWY